MAGRPSNRTSQTQAMPPAAPRQNEYFVPRDGIDREVITSDICRYLGNDALVRPGTYESPDGRVTQGYFITAYRNLTSAMIQDLKADSARWEQERRAASRSSGGAGGSREQARGQSDYSAWKNSQRLEQEFQATYGSAMDIDYAPPPGAAGNPGYAGQPYPGVPAANYAAAAYPPQVHATTSQYPAQPAYAYPPNPPPTQYSPQPQNPGDRYAAIPPPPVPGSYGQDTAFVHGSNFQTAQGYATAGPARMPPPMPHTSVAPSRTFPATTTGASVYGTDPDGYGYAPPTGNPAGQAFPQDPHYGRGPPAQRPGYPVPAEAQYDDVQKNPALQAATTPTGGAPAQMANNGAPAARRDRDSEPREREREPTHRDHRARRSEQERDDRHADRNRHRHR